MKTPSLKLFNLIKSLDSHEKRYFKMQSSDKKEKSSYIKLFDAIDKQVIYDELKLKNKFRLEAFLKNFKATKSYLFDAILSTLTYYHQDVSVDSKLRHLLHQAEVLEKKRMVKIALEVLRKAEMLAIEHEKYEYLLLAGSLKTGIIRKASLSGRAEHYLKTESKKEYDYIARIKNNANFRTLVLRAEVITDKTHKASYPNTRSKLRLIAKSPLLSSPEKALTFSSLRYYYYLHFVCANHLREWNDDAYAKQNDWVSYLEQNKSKILSRADNYIAALSRLMIAQFSTGRAEEAEATLAKGKLFYQTLPSKMKNRNIQAFFISLTSNFMASQLLLIKPDKAILAWDAVKRMIAPNMLSGNANMVLFGNLYCSYFYLGNYREALRYLNKIMHSKEKVRLDVQKDSRLVVLFVHVELGNYDILASLAKATHSWLEENNLLRDFEKLLLNAFQNKVEKLKSTEHQTKVFTQLRKDMLSLVEKPKQSFVLTDFDVISWLDSKIRNISLLAILREKLATNIN